MDNSKQRSRGIILTYIQMVLSIVINVFCLPIILRLFGQHQYGVYSVAGSIIDYLSLFTLGFTASYIRFFSKYKSKNDEEGIAKLNFLYIIIFSILGCLVLITGIVLSFNAKILLNDTYSSTDLYVVKMLMLISTISMAISFPINIFYSHISSNEKFVFQRCVNIISTIITQPLMILILYLGFGAIEIALASVAISLIINIVEIIYCLKKLGMKFKPGKIDFSLFKEIIIFSFFIAINQLIDLLNNQTDKIILGKMINASAVAIYTVAASIQAMYLKFSTAISGVFGPKINMIYCGEGTEVEKDKKLTELFIKVGRIQFFVLMLIFTGFIFFGKYFIQRWAGEEYSIAYYIVLILMFQSSIPLIQNIGIEIQRAKNKHKFRSLVYLIIAVSNVILSIILCKFIGIMGVTIGTLASGIIGTGIIINIYYHKKLGINIKEFWKEIFKASRGLIIPVLCGVLIYCFVRYNNLFIFALFVLAYTFIYMISVFLFGFNESEKNIVNKVFSKFKKVKQL